MRSFEERKEEIFSRSRVRIAHRKKIVKHVVMTCVPVALCLTVLTGVWAFRGGLKSMDGGMESAPESPMYNGFTGSTVLDKETGMPEQSPPMSPPQQNMILPAAISLQMQTGDMTQTCTDAESLRLLENLLPRLEAVMDSAEYPTMSPGGDTSAGGTHFGTGNIDYTLTVTFDDGSVTAYTLSGNRLSGPEGSRNLTDQQLQWLKGLWEEDTR